MTRSPLRPPAVPAFAGLVTAFLLSAPSPAPPSATARTTPPPSQPGGRILPMPPLDQFQTENVLVILLGGIRQSECLDGEGYGDCHHLGTDIRPNAVWYKNFLNTTRTGQQTGRAVIATGERQGMRGGPNATDVPSLVQAWRWQTGAPKEAAWVIGSNQEASVDDGNHPLWAGQDLGPMEEYGYTDRGAAERMIEVLNLYRPRIAMLVFQGPDEGAQYGAKPWRDYRRAIVEVDSLAWAVGEALAAIPDYGARTAVFYTDFHGRHTDDAGTFEWHGDGCIGCRRVTFLATGPDFDAGKVVTREAEQMDLTVTMARLLGVELPRSDGALLEDLFLPGRVGGRAPTPRGSTTHQPPPSIDGDLIPIHVSTRRSRFPDIHRVGPQLFVSWSEPHPGLDGHGWDIWLVSSTDGGITWSDPDTVIAASPDTRPYQATLAGDVTEGLVLGASVLRRVPAPVDSSWVWRPWSVRYPPGSPDPVLLPEPRHRPGYIGDRPAVLAGDGHVLQVHTDTHYRRYTSVWPPGDDRWWGFLNTYSWSNFGYPDGVVVTADTQGPLAFESLRAGARGILTVTRQKQKRWGDTDYLFTTRGHAAIQPAAAAVGDRVLAVWIDDADSIWTLRSAFTDTAPGGWSDPIAVAPGTGPAWMPDLWMRDEQTVVVWEEYSGEYPRILLSSSPDYGATWSPPQVVTSGSVRSPRVVADRLGALVVWEDLSTGASDIVARRMTLP